MNSNFGLTNVSCLLDAICRRTTVCLHGYDCVIGLPRRLNSKNRQLVR